VVDVSSRLDHLEDEKSRAWAIEDVLDAALTATGAEVAEIFLRGEGDSVVSLAGLRGPHLEAFTQITRFEEGEGYPGLVVSEGTPLKATDAPNDERFLRTSVKKLGFCCFLCVPIPGRERPIGSLDVAWRDASHDVFSRCISLSRDAERLALLLDRDERVRRIHELRVARIVEDAHRLDIRVLGSFEARRGTTILNNDSFERRRALTLLKILITHYGRIVPRDELIEMLWPGDAPKDAANLLKIAVHYLRRGLGEGHDGHTEASFIHTEPNGYAFNTASFHKIDALEFEAVAGEGLRLERQGRWREAVSTLRVSAELYGGDYLEDEPYSDWCSNRRRHLQEMFLEVLLTSARLLRCNGDYDAAAHRYRRVLELDRSLEDVHRDLMEVLCRSGKRTQALRQFEACRQALREEFDVAPALETEALYRRIQGRLTV
jgi:DNA-binding SARP family transcriptional activator